MLFLYVPKTSFSIVTLSANEKCVSIHLFHIVFFFIIMQNKINTINIDNQSLKAPFCCFIHFGVTGRVNIWVKVTIHTSVYLRFHIIQCISNQAWGMLQKKCNCMT